MSQPASTGPATEEMPMNGPNAPNATARSSGGKTSVITPRPWGSIKAPNAPWATRKVISSPGAAAMLHSSEAAVKPSAPTRNIRRRP